MERFPIVEKSFRILFVHNRTLSQAVLFVFGIIWVFLFPVVCISSGELKCRGTYMSENALLPAGARTIIEASDLKVADSYDKQIFTSRKGLDATVLSLFEQLSVSKSFIHYYNNSAKKLARNYVSIFRPRPAGDRRESILLIAGIPDLSTGSRISKYNQTRCCSGLSIILAILNKIKEVKWLSKNIIFLVSETEYGVAEFLHELNSPKGNMALKLNAGNLAGGVNIRMIRPPKSFAYQQLLVETQGLNGQLPNLDLFNTVVRVNPLNVLMDKSATRNVHLYYLNTRLVQGIVQKIGLHKSSVERYFSRMENVFRFMYRTAISPTGWHTHLLPYRIDSLTLSLTTSSNGKDWLSPIQLMETTEQVIRSLSNLEEKLHQSYYLYLLPDPWLFVSINEYAGPMALCLAPIILDALYLVYPKEKASLQNTDTSLGFLYSIFLSFISTIMGSLLFKLSLAGSSKSFFSCDTLWEKALTWPNRTIAMSTMIVATIIFSYQLKVENLRIGADLWQYLKLALYTGVFTTHTILGVLNFPLAFGCSLIVIPFYRSIVPARNVSLALYAVWWIFTSPVCGLYLLQMLVEKKDEFWLSPDNIGCEEIENFNPIFKSLAMVMTAYNRYNAMHLPYLCLAWSSFHFMALWIMFLPCYSVRLDKLEHEKSE